jgi:hypothetical protein
VEESAARAPEFSGLYRVLNRLIIFMFASPLSLEDQSHYLYVVQKIIYHQRVIFKYSLLSSIGCSFIRSFVPFS